VKKLFLLAGAVGVAFGLVIAGAAGARGQATRIQIVATMIAGDETPTPKGEVAAARGSFSGTLTKSDSGTLLNWQLSFGGLTGDAIAAHIHIADRGSAGPVVVPLCSPCTSGATGTANINATVLEAIQNDRAYVNVHTKTNPAGEVRGQLSPAATVKTSLRASEERPGCLYAHDHQAGLLRCPGVAVDVQPAHRQGVRCAHPQRCAWQVWSRDRAALRALPDGSARTCGGQCLGPERASVGPYVRERSYGQESGR